MSAVEKVITDADLAVLFKKTGATFQKQEGPVKVYASKGANLTISVFPGPAAGQVKVRIVRGCTC